LSFSLLEPQILKTISVDIAETYMQMRNGCRESYAPTTIRALNAAFWGSHLVKAVLRTGGYLTKTGYQDRTGVPTNVTLAKLP
jgi:hypothetical protein